MMQAVANIVAISARIPATIGFGVHRYSMFEPSTPTNTAICINFITGRA